MDEALALPTDHTAAIARDNGNYSFSLMQQSQKL
jgi:hypothetical protein